MRKINCWLMRRLIKQMKEIQIELRKNSKCNEFEILTFADSACLRFTYRETVHPYITTTHAIASNWNIWWHVSEKGINSLPKYGDPYFWPDVTHIIRARNIDTSMRESE